MNDERFLRLDPPLGRLYKYSLFENTVEDRQIYKTAGQGFIRVLKMFP